MKFYTRMQIFKKLFIYNKFTLNIIKKGKNEKTIIVVIIYWNCLRR